MTLAQPDGLASLSMASTNKLLLAQDFKDVRCRVRGWSESLWFRDLRFAVEVSKPMAKKGLGIYSHSDPLRHHHDASTVGAHIEETTDSALYLSGFKSLFKLC